MSPLEKLKSAVVVVACIGLLASSIRASKETVVVGTKYGLVKGVTVHFPHATGPFKAINKFLGVPYASPPVGELRFRHPCPPKPWNPHTYDATHFHSVCMQKPTLFMSALRKVWPNISWKDFSEDCLFLNIYVPNPMASPNGTTERRAPAPYPVMVYFHGGSYFAGTPIRIETPGEILPLRGVVLVSVQYRLSAFGFLASGDASAPGNAGMLDQVEALKWVKANIRSFGGDPEKVTIFGESAGGSSVGLHTLSPLTSGLFKRAIADSGVDFSPFAYSTMSKVVNFTKELASNLRCSLENNAIMMECLRSIDPHKLAQKVSSHGHFLPVVDSYYLPDTPQRLRSQGRSHKVALLAGYTKDDAGFLVRETDRLVPVADRRVYITEFIKQRKLCKDEKTIRYFAAAIEFQYTPWPHTKDVNKVRRKMIEMYTDYYLSAPTHAVLLLQGLNAPVFMYEFRYRSKHDNTTPSWMGVSHGSNSKYIFGLPFLNMTYSHIFDERDRNLSELVMTLYTNFAKYGHPTPKPVGNVIWEHFNSKRHAYIRIDSNSRMATKYHPHRIAFWNHFYPHFLNITPDVPMEPEQKEEPVIGTVNGGGVVRCCSPLLQTVAILWVWKRLS